LVRSIARRFQRKDGPELDDLISEGVLGLLAACKRYDPSRGATFGAYARFHVLAHVSAAARKSHPSNWTRLSCDPDEFAVWPADPML
jgi:DNA-directed RNA polymerase specialized sigma subunit